MERDSEWEDGIFLRSLGYRSFPLPAFPAIAAFPALPAFSKFLGLLQQLGRGGLVHDQFVHEPAL